MQCVCVQIRVFFAVYFCKFCNNNKICRVNKIIFVFWGFFFLVKLLFVYKNIVWLSLVLLLLFFLSFVNYRYQQNVKFMVSFVVIIYVIKIVFIAIFYCSFLFCSKYKNWQLFNTILLKIYLHSCFCFVLAFSVHICSLLNISCFPFLIL